MPVLTFVVAPALPAGLTYTTSGGRIAGTPTATVTFSIEVICLPVQVIIGDATAAEGFTVTLSRVVSRSLTLEWTAGRPGNVTPGEDCPAEVAGRLRLPAGTLAVRTLDDLRVERTETFVVTLPDDPLIEIAEATAKAALRTMTRNGRASRVWGWCRRAWGGCWRRARWT